MHIKTTIFVILWSIIYIISSIVSFVYTNENSIHFENSQTETNLERQKNIFETSFLRLSSIVNFGVNYGNNVKNSSWSDFIKLSGLEGSIEESYINELRLYYNVSDTERNTYENMFFPIKSADLTPSPVYQFYCPQTFLSSNITQSLVRFQGVDICHVSRYFNLFRKLQNTTTFPISNIRFILNSGEVVMDILKPFDTGFVILSIKLNDFFEFSNTFHYGLKSNVYSFYDDNQQLYSNLETNFKKQFNITLSIYGSEYTLSNYIIYYSSNFNSFIIIGVLTFLYILGVISVISFYKINKNKINKIKYKANTMIIQYINHELRNPLNVISGTLELIIDEISNEQIKSDLHTAFNCCKIIQNILSDVNDIRKLQDNEFHPVKEEFNISELIEDLQKMILFKNNEFPYIEFIIHREYNTLLLFADKQRIEQIMFNFLTNAFKFTEHGKIEFFIKETEEFFLFEVKDTGLGITESNKNKIFKPYPNISSISLRGFGIGLYLCKLIAVKLGYDIFFESEEKKGSVFGIKVQK